MEVNVLNIKGEDTGRKITLNESIFGIEPNDHAIYLDVKQFMANQRQGTHKSKERSEISGSTRKLGRQKGGGGAGRPLHDAVFVQKNGSGVPHDIDVIVNDGYGMAAFRQLLGHRGRNTAFYFDVVGRSTPGTAVKPARRADSFLRCHAEVDDARDERGLRLRLTFAAHASIDEPWAPVLEKHGRRECMKCAFAWHEAVHMGRVQ